MKKKLALVLIAALAFLLVSCGKNAEADVTTSTEQNSVWQQETETESITIPTEPAESQSDDGTTKQSTTTSETGSVSNTTAAAAEVKYAAMNAFWKTFQNAEELVKAGDVVIVGKVTGISFQVWDYTTGLPPNEETEEHHRALFTIYDVDIVTSYKGDRTNSVQIIEMGGAKDYHEEEQINLVRDMKAWPPDCIPVYKGIDMPVLKIGETYLFVLHASQNTDFLSALYPVQAIHNLQSVINPRRGEEPSSNSTISAANVVSVFGEEKWDELVAQLRQ